MGAYKAKQPRARVPFCWACDRRLYGAGRFYTLVVVDGVERPVHQGCVSDAVAHGGELVPEEPHGH